MIHPITDRHYQLICEWWQAHNFPIVSKEFVSTRGFIFCSDEKPIVAAWVMKEETCGFGMLEWLVFNPEATSEERETGFRELVSHCETVAKEIGVKGLLTTTNNQNLAKRFLNHGFHKSDEGVIFLIKGV